MKWIVVTAALPTGSVEAFLLPELRTLAAQGEDILVVPVRPRSTIIHREARGLPALTLPIISPRIVAGALRAIARSPRRAARVVAAVVRGSPRIVMKNLAVLPKALWLSEVVRAEHIDHVHAHFASTPATLAYVVHLMTDTPWSATAHRWDIADDNLLAAKAATAAFLRVIDTRGQQLLERLAGIPAIPLRLGVDIPLRGAVPTGPLRLVVAARLVEVKGHRDLLDAIARLDIPIHLDIAGDGPLRATLEHQTLTLGIADRVTFLGTLDHADLRAQLAAGCWDIAVLPSIETARDWEGIPIALVEAMAVAIPVIATSTGGIPELLADGAGILVPQRDPSALAAALLELARDPAKRRTLGERGRARARDTHEVEIIVAALIERVRRSRPP